MFAVGVAKATALSGWQYLSMILDALHASLVPAAVPQPEDMSALMREVTWLSSLVLRQMHDCRAACPSPHLVDIVSSATLYEMALEAHGALGVVGG